MDNSKDVYPLLTSDYVPKDTGEITDDNYYIESDADRERERTIKVKFKEWWTKRRNAFVSSKLYLWIKTRKSKNDEPENMWSGVDVASAPPEEIEISPYNPDIVGGDFVSLASRISGKVPIHSLDITVESMKFENMNISHLICNYSQDEIMSKVSLDDMIELGLSKYHFIENDSWTVDKIAIANNVNKHEVYHKLNFAFGDIIASLPDNRLICELGKSYEQLLHEYSIDFASIYALGMNFDDFARTFDVKYDDILKSGFTKSQQTVLQTDLGWTCNNISKYFGINEDDVSKIWNRIELPEGFSFK